MKKVLLFFLCLCSVAAIAKNVKGGKCEASVNGLKIKNVYIMGNQYNGVAWGYKHIAEETCLTPTIDIAKADAILEVRGILSPGDLTEHNDNDLVDVGPPYVSCFSGGGSLLCSDSMGNDLHTTCDSGGCYTTYGPSANPLALVSLFVEPWLSSRWYEADVYLYTRDHKLIWKSLDQKSSWTDMWPDRLRLGTNSPECKKPMAGSWNRHNYKNYRHWAGSHCGVTFDPLVSIDIKLKTKKTATDPNDQLKNNTP